jgi:hypothetical protein
MLDATLTHLVLVRSWKGNSWSFPKGKINEFESEYDCAMRECYEETGYNPTEYCSPENFVIVHEKNKVTKLFIAVGVPKSTIFIPQTRKEISKVDFFNINKLPKKCWGVHPFLPNLTRWITKKQKIMSKSNISQQSAAQVTKITGILCKSNITSNNDINNSNNDINIIKRIKKNKKLNNNENNFDIRNIETFSDDLVSTTAANAEDSIGSKGWSVQDMFNANSKLTGNTYTYDGNPHNFGSTHPKYRNYNTTSTTNNNITAMNNDESDIEYTMSSASNYGRSNNLTVIDETINLSNPIFFPKNFKFDTLKIMKAINNVLESNM